MADDDPGQAHLKNAMGESQDDFSPNSPAGRGVSGYGSKDKAGNKSASSMGGGDNSVWNRQAARRGQEGIGDQYQDEWEPEGFTAGGKRVNRKAKGNKR